MNTYKKLISYLIASLSFCLGIFLPNTQAQVAFSEHYEMSEGLKYKPVSNNNKAAFVPGCDLVSGFKVLTIKKNSIKVGWIHPNTDHTVKYKLTWTDGGQTFSHEIDANANAAAALEYTIDNLTTNINYNISIIASCNISVKPNLNDTWVDGDATVLDAIPMSDVCEAPIMPDMKNYVPNTNSFYIGYDNIVTYGLLIHNNPPSFSPITTYLQLYRIRDGELVYNGLNTGQIISLDPCEDYHLESWIECTINNKQVKSNVGAIDVKTLCCGDIKNLKITNTLSNNFDIAWELSPPMPTNVTQFNVYVTDTDDPNVFPIASQTITKTSSTQNKFQFTYTDGIGVGGQPVPNLLPITEYKVKIVPDCNVFMGEPSIIKVTTEDACAAPKSITVDAILQTEGTVRWTQQSSSKYRAYKLELRNNVGTLIETKWISSGTLTTQEMEYTFNKLVPNKLYEVTIFTFCCNDACCNYNPHDEKCVGWIKQPSEPQYAFSTKPELCMKPLEFITEAMGDTKIKVNWKNPNNVLHKYRLEILKDALPINYLTVEAERSEPNAVVEHIFEYLDPNTKYSIVLSSTCLIDAGSSSEAEKLRNEVTTNPSSQSSDCSPGTTFAISEGFENAVLTWTSTSTKPLNKDGRRFIVNIKSTATVVPPLSSMVIDADNTNHKVTISGLVPNTDYTAEITEAFDWGANNLTYTTACATQIKAFKTKNKSDLCDAVTITPKCNTGKSIIFDVVKGNSTINIRARTRNMVGYLINKGAIANTPDCAIKDSGIPVDITAGVGQYVVKDITVTDVGEILILQLDGCGYYEVMFDVLQQINGTQQTCSTIVIPTYLVTLDTQTDATLKDEDHDGIPDYCDPKVVISPPNVTATALPPVSCNNTTPTTPSNAVVKELKFGDVFYLKGIPCEVTMISGDKNSGYSGECVAGLPFDGLQVISTFSGIKVNTDNFAIAGQVKGKNTDDKVQIKEVIDQVNRFNKEKLGDFCNKPVQEGFINGVNTITGQPVDPRGFDAKGDYARIPPYPGYVYGAPYDHNYTPEGLDKDGKPIEPKVNCDTKSVPYCWLQNQPAATTAGLDLFDSKKADLRNEILAILNNAKLDKEQKKNQYTTQCDAIRKDMEVKNATLLHERVLVFGPKDAWINQGMNKSFGQAPSPFGLHMDRKDPQAAFEKQHINLFYCDVNLTEAIDYLSIIELLSNDPILKTLVESIAFKMKRLDETTANAFKTDKEAFAAWLSNELKETLDFYLLGKKQQAIKIGAVESEKKSINAIKIPSNLALATNDNNTVKAMLKGYAENPNQAAEDEEALLQFEFEQGFNTVGGINRAFILRELVQQRNIKNVLEMTTNPVSGLPLSIGGSSGATEKAVYFDNVTLTPTGASLDIYVIVTTPKKQIVFQALNVNFEKGGFGATPVKLGLASNVSFPINNVALITLMGGADGCNVTVDCKGFKELHVSTQVEFCRKYMIPLDKGTMLEKPGMVTCTFNADVQSFHEITATLDIDPFALADYPETKFKVSRAYLDLSDTKTEHVILPVGYTGAHATPSATPDVAPTATPQWKGFYMASLEVILPKELTAQIGGGANEPAKFNATNLIIDDGGISVKAKVTIPILPIEKGKIGSWAFSINYFNFNVVNNSIREGGFGGKIRVPITKDTDYFQYTAAILPFHQYQFSLKPLKDVEVPLWVAEMTISATSTVMVEYKQDAQGNGKFLATAKLDGD